MLRRAESAPPPVWWAWACIALFGAGACTVLGPALPAALTIGYGLGTLYPALLLAGALVYVGRAVPAWLVPAAFGIGALRGLEQLAGAYGLAHGTALVVEPAGSLIAAVVLWRGARDAERSLSQAALPPALVAVAALDGLTAVALLGGEPLPGLLLGSWLIVAPSVLALQLAAWGERSRREVERQRDQLEERVAEETQRYRTVSELSSDWSFSYLIGPDRSLRVEWITEAFSRITGWDASELEGRRWIEFVPPADRSLVFEMVDAVLSQERTAMDLPFRTRRGAVLWLNVRVATLHRTEDGWMRVVGATRDITERRRAERERRRLDERMRRKQRMESLGRLAGGIAHDFNNVLTVIIGNTKLALADHEAGRFDPQRLHRVEAAARHAAGLTEQILAYSGKSAVVLEPLDLPDLVAETLDLARASLGEGAVLATDLPAGLPAVEGDATQLRQVLLNLITNASEALGGERGLVRVRVGERSLGQAELDEGFGSADAKPGAYVFLEVRDDGEGFDPAGVARLFEPFYSTKAAGRGLGLAAVHGIVRAHHGVVRVETGPGRGTSFSVLLPRSDRVAAEKAVAAPAPAAASGGRVLVVDDDADVLEVARAYLERAGFEVRSAPGGGAALAILRDEAERFDAVVLDLVMPDLSGEATYLALRTLRPRLPVVLASGFDREQAARRFSAGGIADFVRKPYEPEDLVASVRNAAARVGA